MVSGLIVICGPTATGKSDQALALAPRLGSPLINADSRQIYRDFTIGTAKPSAADQARWPHHLIDIAAPTEVITVAQYQALAQELIREAHQQGKIPILVGGTGLYIQSVTQGLGIPAVPPQPQLRSQLQGLSQPICYQFLQQVDPASAQKIHANDTVRTLRALEIFYTTGQPASALQTASPPNYPILILGLFCTMDRLKARITHRTERMLHSGWVEEVKILQERYGPNLPLLKTLGYDQINQYLEGEISWPEVCPLIVHHTRLFAKRQLTWFRRMESIQWLDCEAENLQQQIWQRVEAFLGDLSSNASS